jgi:excisionase family DNA binding protein
MSWYSVVHRGAHQVLTKCYTKCVPNLLTSEQAGGSLGPLPRSLSGRVGKALNMKSSNNNGDGHLEAHEASIFAVHEGEFEPLLDSEEAAALLKIHPKTLQRMARRGEVVAIRIGKLWRFRASGLNEWLQKLMAEV